MKPVSNPSRLALWLSWMIAAIMVLLPFHALLTTWAASRFGDSDLLLAWKELLMIAMAAPTGWLLWRSPPLKRWLFESWLPRLIIIYVLVHLGLGWWAWANHQVGTAALAYGLTINLRFLFFFAICLIVAAHSQFLYQHWQKILLAPATVVVAFGLVQKAILEPDFLRHFGYGPNTIEPYQTVDANLDYRRIQSTSRGANPLGAYLLLIITVAALGLGRSIFKITGLLGALLVLFYSYSRSAWVGLIISLLIISWLGLKKASGKWLAAVIVIILMAAGAGYNLRSNQAVQDVLLHTSSNSTSALSSNEVREIAIKEGLNNVAHQPEGRGPGTAGPASFRNILPARIAENYYLQIGQEVGMVGVAVFVAINVLVARLLWLHRQDILAKALLASLVGITFINLVSHAWTDDALSLLWWGLAGVAIGSFLNSPPRRTAQR